jgi:anti-sigma factor RsiW
VSTAAPDTTLLIHAYLDGELDPANALALERQIAADAALAAELSRVQALQHVLRERFPPEPVPTSLRARIDAAVGLGQQRSRPRPKSRPTWQALAASVVLAAALSSGSTWLALNHVATGDRMIAEIVDGHLRGLIAQQPFDVASSDRHTVKPWFNGRIAQAPRVIDLAAEGFPLSGARIDVVGTTPVPTLVYGRLQHVISLSAVRTGRAASDPTARDPVNGYNVVTWTSDGTTYWAVSDLNVVELETFAKFFRAAPAG